MSHPQAMISKTTYRMRFLRSWIRSRFTTCTCSDSTPGYARNRGFASQCSLSLHGMGTGVKQLQRKETMMHHMELLMKRSRGLPPALFGTCLYLAMFALTAFPGT